jgi:hypothetical protein
MKAFLVKSKIYTRWILFAITILYIITGLGITQYQIIEKITGGILTKAFSFQIHDSIYLLAGLLIFLFLHIFLAIYVRRMKK